MINIVYNRDMLAIASRETSNASSIPVMPYEMFGTEYGMFIPVALSGYHFVRWVRKGMIDSLGSTSISTYCIHISNSGEMMHIYLDLEDDLITAVPYCSEKFSLMNAKRDTTEAYSVLMRDCETIHQAAEVVENGEIDGMYQPQILLVKDWVEHAKKMGYTKNFYRTRFSE